jgi:hypothetical protein
MEHVRKLSLYGQFVWMSLCLITSRMETAGGRTSLHSGRGKYIDAFGVSNLDLQGEINIVRPYTYSHNTNSRMFELPAAIAIRWVQISRRSWDTAYQPIPRLTLVGKLVVREYRPRSQRVLTGDQIFSRVIPREQEYDNKIGQGISMTSYFGRLRSLALKHNLFIDASLC